MRHVDGEWVRLLADPTSLDGSPLLEMRAQNSGLGSDPRSKPRHQYRVQAGLVLRRVLPPESVGDRWRDDDVADPWWEPVIDLPPGGPLLDFALSRGIDPGRYTWQARHRAGHVIAYTPTGREVRRLDDGRCSVQPHNDNYSIDCRDLPEARLRYYRPHGEESQ